MKKLSKFSFGIGDRFAHQGQAQLEAFVEAKRAGIDLVPVWNKSNREHTIIHSEPDCVRAEAEAAIAALGWKGEYHVDADHINLTNVDRFISASDFYTHDVADYVGKPADSAVLDTFLSNTSRFVGSVQVRGLAEPMTITTENLHAVAAKFLGAMIEAGKIYRHIEAKKGADNFIAEVSVDETDQPQTPVDLFLILAMLAQEKVPVQTIAPKFTGRFNKGVDYVGDLAKFEKELEADLCVIAFAIREFGLPENLKLSVHSGSDKFSLYPIINRLVKKHGVGLHVKTAGTTWLEEVIGLAESGGEALEIAKEIYAGSFSRFDELTGPYATVIDIDRAKLPQPSTVRNWSSEEFTSALRHDQNCPGYNNSFRQLVHVGFKVAAQMEARYTDALKANRATIARNVKVNLLNRHILPIFG